MTPIHHKSQKSHPSAADHAGTALVNNKKSQVANFSSDKEYIIKGKYRLVNYCKGGAFGDVYFA